MKPQDLAWQRLAVAARRTTEDGRDTAAPHGFATRVAALALSTERPLPSSFERFSWRALGVAGLLAVACAVADFSVFNGASSDDDILPDDGVVTALLDYAS